MSEQIEQRVHHPYSPSSLQSLEACPCYLSKDSQHVRTIIGTIAHEVTDTREDDNRLADDDSAAAAECIDFYDRRKTLMEDRRAQELIRRTGVPPIVELRETYLRADDCVFDDVVHGKVVATTAGYVDRALVWGAEAELFDWKFGMWPVESAENNLQGIAYTIGLMRHYLHLQRVTFFFKQPLIGSLTSATFERKDIPALFLRVQTVVARARQARALAKAGDWSMANPMVPACNFCANLGICPKVAAFACHVGKKFYPVGLPDDISPNKVMAPDQTALAMRLADLMKTWSGSFRTQVTDRVLRGAAQCPPGYHITTSSRRSVVDSDKFKSEALRFLTKEEFDSTLSIEFGGVEEKISEKSPRGQKKATVELFKKALIDSGAVVQGEPYAFLRVTSEKSSSETPKQ
jgi:hypothetical protein